MLATQWTAAVVVVDDVTVATVTIQGDDDRGAETQKYTHDETGNTEPL